MGKYSIKELERLTGVKAHTIRIWEKRYNIVKPERTDTNIRYYGDEDLTKLLNISLLNRHGLKISKLSQLTTEEINDKVRTLTNDAHDYDSQIENLVISMIEYDERKFEKIVNESILKIGFEDTLVKIIYPFFQKIGMLWQTGSISPAQEHFISNLLRQKLIVSIDGLPFEKQDHSKTAILFLPEGEIHELGLLFYQYLIKKENHKVIYLGQTVPFDDLIEVSKFHEPEFMLTSFTSNLFRSELREYIKRLGETFPNITVYINGLQAVQINFKLPDNIKVITSAIDFKDELKKYRKAT